MRYLLGAGSLAPVTHHHFVALVIIDSCPFLRQVRKLVLGVHLVEPPQKAVSRLVSPLIDERLVVERKALAKSHDGIRLLKELGPLRDVLISRKNTVHNWIPSGKLRISQIQFDLLDSQRLRLRQAGLPASEWRPLLSSGQGRNKLLWWLRLLRRLLSFLLDGIEVFVDLLLFLLSFGDSLLRGPNRGLGLRSRFLLGGSLTLTL